MRALRSVARRADLLVPESTKCYLAGAKLSEARKALIVQHLARFYTYKRIPFDKPHYVPVDTLPFIPMESEVDQLISGVGKKTTVYLQLLKETGALTPRKLVQADSCRNDVWSGDSLINRPRRTLTDPIEEDETSRIFLAQYRSPNHALIICL